MKSLSLLFIAAFVAVFTTVAGRLPALDEAYFPLVVVKSAIVAGVPALLVWSLINLLATFRSRTF
ncbi:hypothetical protein [Accumulibacter sp.]|uniref:hypothetical protein n=1 Tax=Accumulibacter sp. TaxID=2053492 RepID=UPI0025DB42EC|nr:hypothetical protein [Accumulibacter sp.]MCM8611159.1 hypothetical protein [Accumulibacter sp.]MCM8636273.1 hypothetical protein [Accumulibacter sp.]MCM8638484.1 hypothetical protein [Accumulibacter sp.]